MHEVRQRERVADSQRRWFRPAVIDLTDRPPLSAKLDLMAPGWLFLLVAGPLFALFLATATTSRPYHIDPFTNAVAGWKIGTSATVVIDEYRHVSGPEHWRSVGWFVPAHGGAVSKYPPGAALWAAPFYAVAQLPAPAEEVSPTNGRRAFESVTLPMPSIWPAAIAASLSVALAMGALALSIRTFAPALQAVAAGFIFGLGTTAWGVASDQLWQHGPAMMWIAFGGLAASFGWAARSGAAYAAAIVTRPITALIAAALGVATSLGRRFRWHGIRFWAAAGAGVITLVAYNWWTFGGPSVAGGYSSDAIVANVQSADLWSYARNVWGGLADPATGILLWSPFLLPLAVGAVRGWRVAPRWARASAVGAVVYLAVQWKANRFSGGVGFVGYRYPLEALMAAAPLLVVGYREWVAEKPVVRLGFFSLVAIAVALQAYGVAVSA